MLTHTLPVERGHSCNCHMTVCSEARSSTGGTTAAQQPAELPVTCCSLDAAKAQAPEGDPAGRRKVVLAKRQPRQTDKQAAAAPKPAAGRKERPQAAAGVQPAAGRRDRPQQAGSKPGPAGTAPKSAVQQVWPMHS